METNFLKKFLIAFFVMGIIVINGFQTVKATAQDSIDVYTLIDTLKIPNFGEDSIRVFFGATDIDGVKKAIVEGLINVEPCLVWQALLSKEKWNSVDEKVIEYASNDTFIVYSRVNLPTFLLKDREYVIQCIADRENYIFSWTLVEGRGNINECSGSWIVMSSNASETQSYVRYTLYTDPNLKWIPRFLVDWATKKTLPGIIPELYERATRQTCP